MLLSYFISPQRIFKAEEIKNYENRCHDIGKSTRLVSDFRTFVLIIRENFSAPWKLKNSWISICPGILVNWEKRIKNPSLHTVGTIGLSVKIFMYFLRIDVGSNFRMFLFLFFLFDFIVVNKNLLYRSQKTSVKDWIGFKNLSAAADFVKKIIYVVAANYSHYGKY